MTDPFPLRNYEETLAEVPAVTRPGWLKRAGAWLKSFAINWLDGDFVPVGVTPSGLPRSNYPYGRDVGQGLDSNVVMSPVSWVVRNFTEAEAVTERRMGGEWQPLVDHPLTMLLDQPNEFYDGDALWKATLISYVLDGNGYWLKIRNGFGGVVQLWYLPHYLVEPIWPRDGSTFISHYNFRPEFGGTPTEIPVRDMVHMRYGLDPRNTRKGLSTVKTLLREVFTDEEAANFSASILRNMGVPGGVIAPKDASALPSEQDVADMKDYMRTAFTGDRRGDWLVLGTPTSTEQFGFDPQSLMLAGLRDITEERVCAAIGIPAAVVGFGAGLQQTKVGATMKELRRSAWVNCVIPHQTTLGRQVGRQLIPDFQAQARRFRVRFDTRGVSAFAEEETEKTTRVTVAVAGGVMRVDEGREELGLPPDDGTDVYLRPTNLATVPADTEPPPGDPSANGGPPAVVEDTELDKAFATVNRAEALLNAQTTKG